MFTGTLKFFAALFVVGFVFYYWLTKGPEAFSSGYTKPEHCTGCSLDSEGNLTREFVISKITTSPGQCKPLYSDLPKGAYTVCDPDESVFTLSADGDSIEAHCAGGGITKSLNTYETHGCPVLVAHLNRAIKLRYHIAAGGGQNEAEMFYDYTTAEGWRARETLERFGKNGKEWYQ